MKFRMLRETKHLSRLVEVPRGAVLKSRVVIRGGEK